MSVHKIGLRAIAHATEDVDGVRGAISFASGSEEVKQKKVEGHFGNMINILEVGLTRKREIRAFLERLADAGILSVLAEEVEARLDDDCTFHFRLDKQAAYAESLILAGDKDVIDCTIKVAAYPARRDVALKVLDALFSELLTIAE